MKIKCMRCLLSVSFFVACVSGAQADNQKVLQLEVLVENVLAQNPEIQYYQAEISKASGALFNAQRLPNPELDLGLGRKETANQGHGLAWEIGYAQTFEYPGRIELREAIAKKQIKLAELQLAKFKLALVNRTKNLAFDLYLAQQNKQLAESIAQKAKSLVSLLSKREMAGPALLLERKIIEAGALSFKQQAIQLAGQAEKLSIELNSLGGFELSRRYSIVIPNFDQTRLIPNEQLLVTLALENNHAVLIKKSELLQQGFKVKLSENERYPSFTVRPFYSSEDADEVERIVGAGISVPLPIWNDNSGNIAIEKAQEAQIGAMLKTLEREIIGQVTANYAAYKLQVDQLAVLGSNVISDLRDAARAAEKQYELGVITVSTYLQLQEQYLNNLGLYRNSRIQILKNIADLEQLAGRSIQGGNS